MLNFILKFHTVPTLCCYLFFNDYVGNALWVNLSSPILVPVGAVLRFIRRIAIYCIEKEVKRDRFAMNS